MKKKWAAPKIVKLEIKKETGTYPKPQEFEKKS